MGTKAKSEKWKCNEDWLAFWTMVGLDDPFHDVRTVKRVLLQEKMEAASATELAVSPEYEATGEKLSGGERWISSWMMAFKVFRVPLIATVIFLVGISWWIFSSSFEEGIRIEGRGSQVAATADQRSHSVGMTKVEAALREGVLEVPLDFVKKHRLVSFEYKRMDGPIPLLAYVAPSGNIGTAVGLSEPCHSQSFHLEGNEIVCDLCATRWKLETLAGSEGECAVNPLQMLPHAVQGEKVIIKETDVQNWESRVIRG